MKKPSDQAKLIYKNCKLSIYHQDRPADLEIHCIVVVEGDELELKYDQEDGSFWSWKGSDQGCGHYLVYANSGRRGRAVLHHLRSTSYLNGYWAENGLKGMWRVELGSENG